MASLQAGPSSTAAAATASSLNTVTQEFIVRLPKDRKKRFSMMKFGSGAGMDFAKLGEVSAKMERENNLKEYKTANDLDTMPKFGAGSEYGRDLKEEARRKKYGIIMKKYNPEDQPWLLKVGSGKQAKKFKGVREGTISENTAYYIFVQSPDGAFEAIPVEEWYNFAPVIRYKYLNSDEAEEEFSKRDKTFNYFNIMLKKRMKKEDKEGDHEEGEKSASKKASKPKKKHKDFFLTDMDEFGEFSDNDDEEDDMDDENEEKSKDEGDKTRKKGKAKGKGKRVKNAKQNSEDEAIEESDEGDFDDREVDYMSDTSSSSMSEPEEKEKKYEEKGVSEEAGLRNILASDSEENEEQEGNEEEENDEEKDKEDDPAVKDKKNESESSSSSSDSDSDIDKDEKITSALLMQKEKMDKKRAQNEKAEKNALYSDTTDSKGTKRKAETEGPSPKKPRSYSPLPSAGSSSSDGITEEAIRRYLQRKPMTTKDLLQKFRSKKLNMSSEQMTHTIAQLLKRINPDKTHVNKKLYLSLKKPE